MKTILMCALLLVLATVNTAKAQEVVSFPYLNADNQTESVNGTIWLPSKPGKHKAVVLLHGAGGFDARTTKQYGEFLSKNGFVSLELTMFTSKPDTPLKHLAQLFGAIDYLSKRPDVDRSQISLLGQSYGGAIALYSSTSWANDKFNKDGIKIKSVVALYPTCFFHERLAKQESRTTKRMANFGFPSDFYNS